jgi:coatomer subunit beta'
VKSFEVCEVPVRCAKFVVRKQWVVTGSDDMHMRVYNYNTMEKIREWEAHTDYIRYIEVHPTRPLLLSSSDDMSIKLWDWEKDFSLLQLYEGHAHYVMMVRFNPRDSNTFASASLDRSIKVWGITAGTPHFSLEGGTNGHERGVNCIDYYPGGDKPYLLSGSDDRTIKVWDYQTKACLQTLKGHTHNISSVCFHPRLPLVISACEDGTVRLWHSTTYRPESTLNYGMERAWAVAVTKDANKLAVGYDEGTVVLKLGKERPVASMDVNTGKIVWARTHDIQTMTVKGIHKDVDYGDGERLPLTPRDLGSCEVYPQALQHNCNGQFVCICGDGEYIIYTSQALRNKAFGSALDFVWSSYGTGDFAIRESISRVRTFKNFKDHKQITLPISSAEGIFGGTCLGVKGSDCVVFYDWEEGEFVQKIDVIPDHIYWNEGGDAVVIACQDSFYVLQYNKDSVTAALASGKVGADGVEGSFELETTINDSVRTGQWIGECFLYTNGSGKLNYIVGGEVMTLSHLDHKMYLLGFVPKEDRVYLIDKAYNIVSNKLLLSVLNYQTAVVRKDFATANTLLPTIPRTEYTAVARFLESQGFKEEALAVTVDNDHRFELSIDLKHVDTALQVLVDEDEATASKYQGQQGVPEDSTEVQSKWRRLGDLALGLGDMETAQRCILRSGDMSGLMLLYSASGDKSGMRALAKQARDVGRSNVAFVAYFTCGMVEECIQLLIDTGRIPEATFMARTYMPSKVSL